MVNILKIYYEGSQIRRVAVNSDVIYVFKNLQSKIQSIFQLSDSNSFITQWKDSEGDFILISSDEELAQAVANAEEGLLRLFVSTKTDATPRNENNGVKHPFVVCDGCNQPVNGHRFKCLQCQDFDLCSKCHAGNKHESHDMIRLVKPVFIPREWVFPGARKMWRSMFNHIPRHCNPFIDAMRSAAAEKKEDSENANTEPKMPEAGTSNNIPNENCNGNQENCRAGVWPGVFMDFLNGDFVDAQKLFTEKFNDVFKHVKGGVEVKLDNPLFKTEFKMNPHPTETAKESNEPQPSTSAKTSDSAQPANEQQPFAFVVPSTSAKTPEAALSANEQQSFAFAMPAESVRPAQEMRSVESSMETSIPVVEPVQKTQVSGQEVRAVDETVAEADMHDERPERAEGWTFIERENAEAEKAVSEERVQYPNLDEEVKATSDDNVLTCDPVIISAVQTMRSMGFTNEGGWLERLLIAKNGNLNDVLDSLYPSVNRG